MSGGSYNYIYSTLLAECEGRMLDIEMNDMIVDLSKLLHDLEWYQSGDSSEEKYLKALKAFKAKWFKGNRKVRLKGYIDEQTALLKHQLYALIGEDDKEVTE